MGFTEALRHASSTFYELEAYALGRQEREPLAGRPRLRMSKDWRTAKPTQAARRDVP